MARRDGLRTTRRGFTLAELVLACGIGMVLLGAVSVLLSAYLHRPTGMINSANARMKADDVLRQMARELAAAKMITQIIDRVDVDAHPQRQSIAFIIPEQLTGQPTAAPEYDPNDVAVELLSPPDGITQYLEAVKYEWPSSGFSTGAAGPLRMERVTWGPPYTPWNKPFQSTYHDHPHECTLKLTYELEMSYLKYDGSKWLEISDLRLYSGQDTVPSELSEFDSTDVRAALDILFETYLYWIGIKNLEVRVPVIHIELTAEHDGQEHTIFKTVRCRERPQVKFYTLGT